MRPKFPLSNLTSPCHPPSGPWTGSGLAGRRVISCNKLITRHLHGGMRTTRRQGFPLVLATATAAVSEE
jgi:hypothetical protein